MKIENISVKMLESWTFFDSLWDYPHLAKSCDIHQIRSKFNAFKTWDILPKSQLYYFCG